MNYQPLFVLTIYSHFFKITQPTPRIAHILNHYFRKYDQTQWVRERARWVMKVIKTFAYEDPHGYEFRLHIHELQKLQTYLADQHITENLYTVIVAPMFAPVSIGVEMNKDRILRDYQVPVVDYAVDDWSTALKSQRLEKPETRSKFVGLQTGKGKATISCATVARLKVRTLILIKPTYMEKWVNDIQVNLTVPPHRVMTISGFKQLKALIALGITGNLDADIIIMSSRTHQMYYKMYQHEPNGSMTLGMGCLPDELYPTLGIGLILMDEFHQEFHANYIGLLYTHVPRILVTTATLDSYDSFMKKMYEVTFPPLSRYKTLDHDKYIGTFAIGYRFKRPEKIRTTEFNSNFYSHTVFEKCVRRHKPTFHNYRRLIHYIVENAYVKRYMPGDKLAIFASSIVMCDELTEYFQTKYPNLSVKRYCEDDPYDNVITPDIRISTPGSMGTGIDIPGLRIVVNTINVDSLQSNQQILGRLRPIPDRDVRYYYIYAENIPKHKEYHARRKKLLLDKVAGIKEFFYGEEI